MADSARPTIVALIAEDGRYADVRRQALERAREAGATLLYFDVDAGGSLLESPLPTEWSGQGQQEQFGDRLDVNDLEAAGRAPIARAVREARDAGIEAWGWLPDKADAEALAEYASAQSASLVIVPEHERDIAETVTAEVEIVAPRSP